MELNGLHFKMTFLLIMSLGSLVEAQIGPTSWTALPFPAPSLPLAVRSPYMNTWLPQGNDPLALNDAYATQGCVGCEVCPYTVVEYQNLYYASNK